MDWLRWHHGTVTDPKWRVVAQETGQPVAVVVAVWAAMMEHASQNSPRGLLAGWRDRVVGAALDLSPDTVAAVRRSMEGLVLEGETLTGWEKRQPKREDPSTERVRAHRERQREVKRGETQGNAPEERREDAEEEAEETQSSSDPSERREREALPDPTDRQSAVFQAVVVANRGMRDNPLIGDALNPIPGGHGSGEVVGEWYDAGIPWETIKRGVYWTAQKYQPSPGNRQINTMRYFDGPVRERHERETAMSATGRVAMPAADPDTKPALGSVAARINADRRNETPGGTRHLHVVKEKDDTPFAPINVALIRQLAEQAPSVDEEVA